MKIVITGGATNEYIDEVMKITNMSTGKLSVKIAKEFCEKGHEVILIANRSVNFDSLSHFNNLKIVKIETTQDLIDGLYSVAGEDVDAVIHSAAVADYKSEFVFKIEDMAKEISEKIYNFAYTKDALYKEIYETMKNPKCKIDDSTKISSYESGLTVKLGLTPKVISNLREFFPNAKIYGFKLLENVEKEKLFEAAKNICIKNNIDGVFANDLKDLRNGNQTRYFVDSNGWSGKSMETYLDIVEYVINF